MPGGGSPFCPDLRIVPLRHRKRPAPHPSAVSAEKQTSHRPQPHFPHLLRAVPPPAPSESCRGTSRPPHDGLRSRRNPSVPLVFRSRAGRNVPPGIDARYTPTFGIARRTTSSPRFPHMPAETGSGIEKPEGTESSVPGERKRPGHPPDRTTRSDIPQPAGPIRAHPPACGTLPFCPRFFRIFDFVLDTAPPKKQTGLLLYSAYPYL